MATERKQVISDVVSFVTWRRRLPRVLLDLQQPDVEFQLAALSAEQNRNYTRLANQFLHACGCASSGFFMSAAVVGMLGTYFGAGRGLSDLHITTLLTFFGGFVLAALFGKFLGLLAARWRLLQLASQIYDVIAKAQPGTVGAPTY
jgi:hypothetical protein